MNNFKSIRKYIKPALVVTLLCCLSILACKKSTMEVPVNVGTVRFESPDYIIENNSTDPLKIVLPLSLPLEEAATVTISVDGSSTIASTEYTTSPAIPAGGLLLNLPKGATEASFEVKSLNNFEGDKKLVFKLTSATGGLSISNTNATTAITIKGDPVIVPKISVSTRTISFGNVAAGSVSALLSYDVWGTKLTSDVTITASANFEISLDGSTFSQSLTIPGAILNIAPSTIFVRFSANTGTNQTINGSITHTSVSVPDVTISTSGVEFGNALPGILIFKDDFEYGTAAGNLKTVTSTWPVFSGTVNPIKYVVPGLSYTGYIGSGKGGAVISENGSGSREDNSTAFTAQTSGTIYVAQMINIATAAAAGDFFTSLRDPAAAYFNRVYVKDNAGSPQIGIAKSSATVAYSPVNYSYGNTYLLVTKYDFTTGVSSMYILSGAIPLIEPAVPDAVTSTGTSPASLVNVCLRQNTTLLTATYDGLRVATSWKDAVGK